VQQFNTTEEVVGMKKAWPAKMQSFHHTKKYKVLH